MANNTVKLAVEEATKKTTAGDGRIVRIIGPVVDVKFDGAGAPDLQRAHGRGRDPDRSPEHDPRG